MLEPSRGGAGAGRARWLLGALLGLAVAQASAAELPVNPGLGAPPPGLDRSTPLATVHGFLNAAHAGDYALAAHFLDLDAIKPGDQAAQGVRLARRLRFVIDRKVFVDFGTISKEPAGDPAKPNWDQIGAVPLEHTRQPIRLTRLRLPDEGEAGAGKYLWVFSPETVKSIDTMFDAYGPPFSEQLPEVLYRHSALGLETWQWIGVAGVLLLGLLIAFALEWGVLRLFADVARLTAGTLDDALVESARGPLRVPVFCGLLALGTRWLMLPPQAQAVADTVARSLLIVSVAWLILRAIRATASSVQEGMDNPTGDPTRLQGMRTQIAVLRRIFAFATYLVGAALFLIQFQVVRHVGVSLLASAGLAGLVVGVAAQKSISTLLAGIQLTITQPIRLGDTVVVEGESGVVEEITLTYVIVRVWDLRRLLVPMTYFLEKPFQNWSKGAHALSATVSVIVHKSVDVDAFRLELKRVLEGEAQGLWDGRYPNLLVTENGDRTLVLRVLVGAKDKGSTWELRSLLQSKLDALLAAHPEWIPRTIEPGQGGPHRGGHGAAAH